MPNTREKVVWGDALLLWKTLSSSFKIWVTYSAPVEHLLLENTNGKARAYDSNHF
jgi:hypothetical protein